MKKYYSVTKDYARVKNPKILYHIVKPFVRLARKKVEWKGDLTVEEPVVFIANHSKAFSPLAAALDFPFPFRPWVDAGVLFYKTCPKYIFENFFPPKGKIKFFRKITCFFAALILVPLLRGQESIPVFRDVRIKKTFTKTLQTLEEQKNIIIFPECEKKYSRYINELNSGFVSVARLYYEKTGKLLRFCPVYVAPQLNVFQTGTPIAYDPSEPMVTQKKRISTYLRDELDRIASELPEFEPIPFMD